MSLIDEGFIQRNPCPFKMKIPTQKIFPEKGGYTLDWENQIDACKIIHQDACIGEKNCPIYNGGMK
jgi:hypothetical protein